jgi:hypothetical protein
MAPLNLFPDPTQLELIRCAIAQKTEVITAGASP